MRWSLYRSSTDQWLGLGAAIRNPKTTLGFMELGAKVLDKTEQPGVRVVNFNFLRNVNPYALAKATAFGVLVSAR